MIQTVPFKENITQQADKMQQENNMSQDRDSNRPIIKSQSTTSSTSQLLPLDFDNNNELMEMGENGDDDIPNVFWDEYDDSNASVPVPYDELGTNGYSIQPLEMKQSEHHLGTHSDEKSQPQHQSNTPQPIKQSDSTNQKFGASSSTSSRDSRADIALVPPSNQGAVDISAAFSAAGMNPALAQHYQYNQSAQGNLFPFGMQIGNGLQLDSRNFAPMMFAPVATSQLQADASSGQQQQQQMQLNQIQQLQQQLQQQNQQEQKNQAQAQIQALNFLSRNFQQGLWNQAQRPNINQNQINQQAAAQQAFQYLVQNSQGQLMPQQFLQYPQSNQSSVSPQQQQQPQYPQNMNSQQQQNLFNLNTNTNRNQTATTKKSNDAINKNVVSSSETDIPSTSAVIAKKTKIKKSRATSNFANNSPIPQVVNSFSNYQDTMSSLTCSNNSSSRDCDAVGGINKLPKVRSNSPEYSDDDDNTNDNDDLNEEHLTSEEKADANRKRNREHARNTRAKKKAYLESLKSTLDVLCRERDSLLTERACAATHLVEVQKIRTEVLMAFFALRSMYEKKRSLWSSILEESVTCVLPVTPYRSFPASEVQISKCQRTILGIDAMMADTASLHVLLNSIVDRAMYPKEEVQFRYTLVSEEAVVSGDQIMARWEMTTTNAIKLGSKKELKKVGMLCARFNSRHKIVSLELIFDVMAFMLQLKQSARSNFLSVVPNTVQTCVGPFGDLPMVMTLAEAPYTIVHVNEKWEEMTGYKSEEVVGKHSCDILQGEGSEQKELGILSQSIQYQRPANIAITNYTRDKKPFKNFFNLYPLSTDSKITHYVELTLHSHMESENEIKSQTKNITEGNENDVEMTVTDNNYSKSSNATNSAARVSKDSGSGSSDTWISKST